VTAPLLEIIADRIRRHGPMTMAEYMALCLGHPKHGYYMSRDPFGRSGDFITAPEVSQMFGEMIGLWIADLWIKMGSPKDFVLLECGPGRGTLMADILRATKTLPGFHEAKKLYLMEMSPVLKDAQKRALSIYDPVWIDDLSQLPAKAPVILVANEFLDALPVRQFERKNGEWSERCVSITDNDTLVFIPMKVDPRGMPGIPDVILESEKDGIFDTSPHLNQFIKSVDILLKTQSGVALFVDYGHERTSMGDTLQAMKSHEYADIFETPGLCDLTAHVDFENIERIAQSDGLVVHGPTTQRAFLKELGIEVRAERLKAGANPDQIQNLESGLNRLIDTKQMGSLFKVLALCHDPNIEIAGFHESL
jgi:NADH dehydrogenase [ubiquinone] 1 alpha subcomplex assembly factor 7